MKLTGVCVDGVGKFEVKSEIRGLGPGVNILSAGNEAGKSTLFRAVRACLFDRHSSKSSDVKKLASEGKQLSASVTIDFEHTGQRYSISKSFLRSPSAKLSRDGVVIARNNEADELLWEILGVLPGARSIDEAAFGLLWVNQGQSFCAPEPTDGATSALNSVIQSEVGSLVGGERARQVLKALDEDLGKVVTEASGRPKAGGPLAEAIRRRAELDEDFVAENDRLETLDRQLGELAAKRKARADFADPVALRKMEDDLETAKKLAKEASDAESALRQLESAVQRCQAVLEIHERVEQDFQTRAERIDASRGREAEIESNLQPVAASEKAARQEINRANEQIRKIDAQSSEEEKEERRLSVLAGAIESRTKREALVSLRDEVSNLDERLTMNGAALASNNASATAAKQVDETALEIERLGARLEAAAPTVAVDLGSAGSGSVSVGGEPIATGKVFSAIEPLVVRIGEIATITVTPPRGAGATDLKKLHDAQERLKQLLGAANFGEVGEFRAARARRELLESEARGLAVEFKAFGFKDAAPAAALERLNADIGTIDAAVQEALVQCKTLTLPSGQEVAAQLEGLRHKREAGRLSRKTFEGCVEAQNEILSELSGKRGRLEGLLSEIRSRLKEDLVVLPDGDRSEKLRKANEDASRARDDYRAKAAACEALRDKTPTPEEIERRQNQLKRFSGARESRRDALGAHDRAIANLEGQIQNAGGDGLGEKVEELRQSRDLAAREVARIEDRVEMLQLLKSTVHGCYQQQRERLQAPLRRYIKPYLNDVFPKAEIELGDGFKIEGLKRNGPDAEDFGRLSAGTQEQIAVLVRLAMGAMLSARGEPVPIILDDALVFSDDERIEQMFDALIRAGNIQQVIVLTCRSRAFSRLGGHLLSIEQTG